MNQKELLNKAKKAVSIPNEFKLVEHELVKHDKIPIYRLRFVKNITHNIYGAEHFSITMDAKNYRLMGLMFLDKSLISDKYVNEEQAKSIAFQFIEKHAPDLIDTVEVRWVRPTRTVALHPPHDEGFKLKDGSAITGMRVKIWVNSTQTYAWVIIGASGDVISFERDIVWDSKNMCRSTEKWLHDDWIQSNNLNYAGV